MLKPGISKCLIIIALWQGVQRVYQKMKKPLRHDPSGMPPLFKVGESADI